MRGSFFLFFLSLSLFLQGNNISCVLLLSFGGSWLAGWLAGWLTGWLASMLMRLLSCSPWYTWSKLLHERKS